MYHPTTRVLAVLELLQTHADAICASGGVAALSGLVAGADFATASVPISPPREVPRIAAFATPMWLRSASASFASCATV